MEKRKKLNNLNEIADALDHVIVDMEGLKDILRLLSDNTDIVLDTGNIFGLIGDITSSKMNELKELRALID